MKKFLLTTLLVLVTVVAAFAQNELTVTHQYNSKGTTNTFDVKDDAGNVIVTLTPASNGGTAPSCNYGSGELRLYSKNTLTIAAKDGYFIQRIDFTGCTSGKFFDSGYKFSNGAIVGTINYPNASWAASDAKTQSVVFTQTSTSGKQTHISKIAITYTKAGATFEEINQTYSKDNATLQLKYSPENLFTGITPIYDVTNANGCIDENLNILKAGTGTLKVTWSGSASSFAEGSAEVKFTINKAKSGLSYDKEVAEAFKGNDNTPDDLTALPSLVNPNGIAVIYSSLYPEYATIDAEGNVKLIGIGETLITATPAEADLYEGEAEYILNVQPAGLPSMPSFSFENNSDHKINETLVISPAAEGDKIQYKVGDGEFKPYEGTISFSAEGVYTVTAYAENDKGKSAESSITFTIELLEYAFNFKEAEGELVLGDTRELEIELEGANIADFNVTFTPETGILLPIPATQNKYYIVGAGDVTFTAEAKVDADLYDGAITKTYTIKPKMVDGGSAPTTVTYDFSNIASLGFSTADYSSESGADVIILNGSLGDDTYNRSININGTTMTFSKGNASTNTRIQIAANSLALYNSTSGGGAFTVKGQNITKIEITESASKYRAKLTPSVGTLSNVDNNNVFTWTPAGEYESQVTFTNKTSTNVRVQKIVVHCNVSAQVAKEFKPYELTLAGSDYEIGEAMPHAVLPEGCTAPVSYLVNDEEEPAYATKHFSEASVKIVAHTPGFGDYLPSVSEAFNITPLPINLPNQLTIHYSQGDGINMEGFKTVAGENGVYVFENIPVIGYDARLADKNYGHVFFSFYNVESTPAAAPRRAAAETDWSEVNNVVTYTPAEHRTVSGLNDEIELVRNKANTISGLPNVLCVPSAHETGKDVTFTVELKDDGTPSKVKLAEGTQTGVESVGVDADGEAEYYTLQGVRVAKPAAGIYLRRQGGTVSKVLVK